METKDPASLISYAAAGRGRRTEGGIKRLKGKVKR
jgi:hypothetical protein